jgi:hypothetical protein
MRRTTILMLALTLLVYAAVAQITDYDNGTADSATENMSASDNVTTSESDKIDTMLDVNVTVQESAGDANLRVKEYYPKGADYVFVCETPGFAPTRYHWYYGDGEKLIDISNRDTFHRYGSTGQYTVQCVASDSSRTSTGTMVVSVTNASDGVAVNETDDGDDNTTEELFTYRVKIQSRSPGQPLSPFIAVTHDQDLDLFESGQKASDELEMIAEEGNSTALMDMLEMNQMVTSVKDTAKPLSGNGTNSSMITFEIMAKEGDRISLASMLVCTNDGFTGLSAASLPASGSNDYALRAYDAGTENNTELAADIPAGCSALGPVNISDNGNESEGIDTDFDIMSHPGLDLQGDLTDEHEWPDTVATVTITRIGMNDTDGSTDGTDDTNDDMDDTVDTSGDVDTDVQLRGENEVPSVDTDAHGSARVKVDGLRLTVDGGFSSLESDLLPTSAAHIHSGNEGENGPVVFPLQVFPSDDMRSGSLRLNVTLTQQQKNVLMDDGYYINVHTEERPSGEIRGQIEP